MTEMTDEAKAARTAELDAKADAQAQAAADPKAKLPEGHVRVRITKMGDGKVHTGGKPQRQTRDSGAEVYAGEDIFPKFGRDDIVTLPVKTAKALEDRGFAEIQD